MHILWTGVSGFIGMALLKELNTHTSLRENSVLLSSKTIDGWKCVLHRNYQFSTKDLKKQLTSDIDTVVHMGAFIPKSKQDANNVEQNTSNVINTLWLLNHLPNIPSKIIFISTVDVYAQTDDIIDEQSPVAPQTLYGWSKLYCEHMMESWCREHQVQLLVLRLGHIYGEGEETYKKLIPCTIKNILNGVPPSIYSSGEETRAFLHVRDCAKMILASLTLKQQFDIINVVHDESLSILKIVELLLAIAGSDLTIQMSNSLFIGRSLRFNNIKAKHLLCQPCISLEKGLRAEYKYFKDLQ